jgi:2-dehydropantoate 2-reductase
VIFGAKTPEPDRATVTVIADPTRIGNPTGEIPPLCLTELAATMRESGIPTEATDKVMAFIWGKVFYNSALNPLSALRNLTYGELADDPDIRAIMDRVIAEAFEVARAESAPLLWETAEDYKRAFYELEVPPTRDHRSSMLQAIERGKRTEIEALNGEIVRRGDRHGVPVETNRELVRLLREKEQEVAG